MSSSWDDFYDSKAQSSKLKRHNESKESNDDDVEDRKHVTGCDWGQGRPDEVDADPGSQDGGGKESSDFIPVYEQYLQDKRSIAQKSTANHKTYQNDPQKVLLDWFESCGNSEEFSPEYEKSIDANQWICNLDLIIDDTDFTLTSEPHARRNEALNEVCLDACRLLDLSGLLVRHRRSKTNEEEEDSRRRKRVSEAMKEDDLVFDRTSEQTKKRHCASPDESIGDSDTIRSSGASRSLSSQVNTYESLTARWQELNMSILKEKARLVKLDLSVAKPRQQSCDKRKREMVSDNSPETRGDEAEHNESESNANGPKEGEENSDEEEEEADPLDKFMSTLETKTKLSMDDKIEKSRIKSQIASLEREQCECARLIAIAKPSASSK
ncbi:Hypothetical predicted protein [Olea europaea subsp. europaea]|uniref:Uncharacterized protein n=1 Tax=Olea europaea subsp. europaea TaxID=158383 RepID=A0A8S0UK92_OLEEU|nr:Hypothetical predicted protein [Olea europaea subsp. europaea]